MPFPADTAYCQSKQNLQPKVVAHRVLGVKSLPKIAPNVQQQSHGGKQYQVSLPSCCIAALPKNSARCREAVPHFGFCETWCEKSSRNEINRSTQSNQSNPDEDETYFKKNLQNCFPSMILIAANPIECRSTLWMMLNFWPWGMIQR